MTKDLTFISEGNEPYVEHDGHKLINIERQEMSLLEIQSFLRFQQYEYTFPIIQPIYSYLQQLISLPEDYLYKISMILEPRR